MKSILLFLSFIFLLAGCSEPDQPSISLYLAVQRGDLDQLERHIYWGTDINQLDPDGNRALHVASRQGRQIIVSTLLKHGAEINLEDQTGHTAIYYALSNGRTQLADLLIARGASFPANEILLEVAAAGITDRDVVRYLVEHGADLEARDENGLTALLIAVNQDNHRMLRHLISHGADVNVRNTENQSALSIAKQQDLVDIAQLLKRNGAKEY